MMNLTSGGVNVSLSLQDVFAAAVGKNVTVVVLCITINYINATMVHTFNRHHIFRTSPRFILFIHLVINDMIQLSISSALFVLSYIVRTLSVPVCCLFIVPAISTTQNTPLNLSLMAAECYLAVCLPLRYTYICTVFRTRLSIALMWTTSLLSVLPDVAILVATEPPDFRHSRIVCGRDSLFRSSDSKTKRDASHIFFLVLVWSTLFYTYFRILFVAKAADSGAKKARSTILLHGFQMLLSMLIYVRPMMLPRFISPFIYGFRDKTFWKHLKKFLCATFTDEP
ncbi:odorant receptor 131-2-like isoform X2 [Takifugu rubripes]|uniref:odorant receptor 131-2-like isoform X2 n=1 Tax=Takifugu rubripes TaxID=31033 RepID=UPI001145BC37|nr:odorant receptor 131-2-like isoform X2 [Takifugu rubripes]